MAASPPFRSPAILSSLRRSTAATRPSRRNLHTTPQQQASILFALSGLSNSRETQHFNKLSQLSRIEHSPSLKLIQSSEVDPFPVPLPAARKANSPSTAKLIGAPSAAARASSAAVAARIWDARALRLGRAVLAEQARRGLRLQKAAARARAREMRTRTTMMREREIWIQERKKLQDEVRSAGLLVLVSVATATALAVWRFWPSREATTEVVPLGERLARRTKAALPLPAAVMDGAGAESAAPVTTMPASPIVSTAPVNAAPGQSRIIEAVKEKKTQWSWRGLFWKQ